MCRLVQQLKILSFRQRIHIFGAISWLSRAREPCITNHDKCQCNLGSDSATQNGKNARLTLKFAHLPREFWIPPQTPIDSQRLDFYCFRFHEVMPLSPVIWGAPKSVFSDARACASGGDAVLSIAPGCPWAGRTQEGGSSITLASSCAPYRIQNPSERQMHPKIHPEPPPETKIRKMYKIGGFRIFLFFFFFCILVLGEDSGCDYFGLQRGFVFCRGRRNSQSYSSEEFLCCPPHQNSP